MAEITQASMTMAEMQSASLDVLEQLLSASKIQQEQLAKDLDSFVLSHLGELEMLYLAEDDDSKGLCASLAPLTSRYDILNTFSDTALQIVKLRDDSNVSILKDKLDKQIAQFEYQLVECSEAQSAGKFIKAFDIVNSLSKTLESEEVRSVPPETLNNIYEDITARRSSIVSQVQEIWSTGIVVSELSGLRIQPTNELEESISVLRKVDLLQDKIKSTVQELHDKLIQPLLLNDLHLSQVDEGLVVGVHGQVGIPAVDLLLRYVLRRLSSLTSMFRNYLSPLILDTVRQDYLRKHLPTQIQATARIQALSHSLSTLSTTMKELGLISNSGFSEIIGSIPALWFEKRRNVVLDSCRQLVLSWTGVTEIIEQNENVTHESLMASADQSKSQDKDEVQAIYQLEQENDDWGVDDWDVDDQGNESSTAQAEEEAQNEVDAVDAWGLDTDMPETPVKGERDSSSKSFASSKTVLLTTRYAISTIPKALLELIRHCKQDSSHLKTTQKNSLIASQADNLLKIPAEVLDLYRALVPLLVTRTGYPRMTIYNDCIYLASQLGDQELSRRIQAFGERFYTLEITEKRNQVQDILSKTDGLVSVTIPEQAELCRSLIQQVLDLLQRTQERYEPQLGRTTMFTALGTLVECAIQYFVSSCTAMTDISEAESIELASLGDQLSSVEGLFRSDEEGTVLTAMWCPTWFKFRLLLDILEAKLDYILQLWRDGDLVDFEAGEVVELIRALFSDSPKRRKAIDEILESVA
jgi:protein transport protein DSL1/ZW10